MQEAVRLVEQRILGEPWALPLLMDSIPAQAVEWSQIATAALKQCKRYGTVSLASIAAATETPVSILGEMAQQNADTSLHLAASMLRDTYTLYLKHEWGMSMARMAATHQPEELARLEKEYYRIKGLPVSNTDSDGREDFEHRLTSALLGKPIRFEVTPPLRGLAQHIPYHQPGDYVIYAGRPGMGKSYIGLNYIYHLASKGKPVALYNMENTPSDLMRRLWSMHTGLQYKDDMSKMDAAKHELAAKGWEAVKKMPAIMRTPKRDIESVLTSIRRDIVEHGIVLAVVDYVQLIKSGLRNRVDDVANASAELRELALQQKIVVIALAQLNRESEGRADKRPILADLRNAGDLEQDAVVVGLLYRPEYYFQVGPDGQDNTGLAEIIIAKGRNTGTGVIECRFDHIRGFTNLSDGPLVQDDGLVPF